MAARPSWSSTAYPKKEYKKRKPSTKPKGSSLKRTYATAGAPPSAGGWRRPAKGTKWIAPKKDHAQFAHLLAMPKYVRDIEFDGLSLKECKKPLPATELVPLPEAEPTRDMILNPSREDVVKGARMAMRGTNSMEKIWRFRVGNSVAISCNGAGSVNAVIAVNSVTLVGDWTSFTAIFDEFFVVSMRNSYRPMSRYAMPPGCTTTTGIQNPYNQPVIVTATHHGAPVATTMTGAAENPTAKLVSMGDPFTYVWKNVEKYKGGVAPQASETGTIPTQGWALTGASATSTYTGQVLYLGIPPVGQNANAALGQFMNEYTVLFRCRW